MLLLVNVTVLLVVPPRSLTISRLLPPPATIVNLSLMPARVPWLVGASEETLKVAPDVEDIAARFQTRTDFLYLGRGIHYPIALEGALKLKEISYIHAEGYPAGEMKHGPIALIDERMPIVTLAPHDHVFEKMLGNVQEAKARGGSVIAFTTRGDDKLWSILDK